MADFKVPAEKMRGGSTGSDCEVCGKPSTLVFETGRIVETCDPKTGCGAAIAWPATVLRMPSPAVLEDCHDTRYQLGLIGKKNYRAATGKDVPSTGGQPVPADPTDPVPVEA